MQICFPDIEYDSAVKPYWNNTCHKLSENLFLPALINNKPNFSLIYELDTILSKIFNFSNSFFA